MTTLEHRPRTALVVIDVQNDVVAEAHARDAVVGRSLVDIDVLGGADLARLARTRLEAGETIPQMEAELPAPDGSTRLVILAGQPIELADQPCMLLTFADLEHRREDGGDAGRPRGDRRAAAAPAHFRQGGHEMDPDHIVVDVR